MRNVLRCPACKQTVVASRNRARVAMAEHLLACPVRLGTWPATRSAPTEEAVGAVGRQSHSYPTT
jgi:uncharacterized protein YbaR (Trm112 family)